MTERWDMVVVGAGPAGSAAALGALNADPDLRVLILDRSDFPRDKACGDGVAPHVLDVLADIGVHGLLDDRVPVRRLRLEHAGTAVSRDMVRPAFVVPRTVLDGRLLESALAVGAVFRRHRVRSVREESGCAVLDDTIHATTVVGADGAHSSLGPAVRAPRSRRALAMRGYAPVLPAHRGQQVIVFGSSRQPSYAWSFDIGDGRANVGYGELLRPGRPAPTRALLLRQLDELLPGCGDHGRAWRGHHLPVSSWSWNQPDGRILLVGDAAGLINPMTGEGIYYAVATGVLAGRSAVSSLRADHGRTAGARHRRAVRSLLGRHLKHTTVAARLVRVPAVVHAGVRAAARDQAVFDDLVEVGLGRGRLTATVIRGLGTELVSRAQWRNCGS
jgi:geranylgeranyl reductase family protein